MIDLRAYPAYGGLDLAYSKDLTAFVLVWPVGELVYCHPWFFMGAEGLAEKARKDNVPYQHWLKDGHIETTPGSYTEWPVIADRILQICSVYQVADIGYDKWGAVDVAAALMKAGVPIEKVVQGVSTYNAPCRRLEELVLSRKLKHNGNPALRWHVDCTRLISDVNANLRPVKPNRNEATKHIDGVTALLMALGRMMASAEREVSAAYSAVY